MPESDELTVAIGHIKHKVDSMDRTLERLLRVNGKAMIEDYLSRLSSDPYLVKIYLAIDGQKTQQIISQETGCSPATVTRRIQTLVDLDLVELKCVDKDGRTYQYTKMEALFKISRQLLKNLKNE